MNNEETILLFLVFFVVIPIILYALLKDEKSEQDSNSKKDKPIYCTNIKYSNIERYYYNDEYAKEFQMSYFELCDYLVEKYGTPLDSYLTDKTCSVKNDISRTSNGLCVHHKEEWRLRNLSNSNVAKNHDFKYQQPENLVYCNYLEHLLLHFKITMEFTEKKNKVGINGFYLIKNDIYRWASTFNNPPLKIWEQNCFNVIKDDLDFVAFLDDKIKHRK